MYLKQQSLMLICLPYSVLKSGATTLSATSLTFLCKLGFYLKLVLILSSTMFMFVLMYKPFVKLFNFFPEIFKQNSPPWPTTA